MTLARLDVPAVSMQLERQGIQASEEHTVSMLQLQHANSLEYYSDPTQDLARPAMSYLPRYVVDKENECFRLFDKLKPALRDQEAVKEFTGVMYYVTQHRRMRRKAYDGVGEDNQPVCNSPDGLKGFGIPGGDCFKIENMRRNVACPHAVWPSKEAAAAARAAGNWAGTRSQCEDRWHLFLKVPEKAVPIYIDGTGQQRIPIEAYRERLMQNGAQFQDVITQVTVKTTGNSPILNFRCVGGVDQSVIGIGEMIEQQRKLAWAMCFQYAQQVGDWAQQQEEIAMEQERQATRINPDSIPDYIHKQAEELGATVIIDDELNFRHIDAQERSIPPHERTFTARSPQQPDQWFTRRRRE